MAMNNGINSISVDDWDKLRTDYSIAGATVTGTISDSSLIQEYPIRGKMLTVQHTVDPMIDFAEKGIKQYLIQKLADQLMDQNVVEFTKLQKPDGSIDYRARIFVTPNDQVQILRTSGAK